MKLEKFKALWKNAITIKEPDNYVGSDFMTIGGALGYGLGIWAKNPIKGTVIVPTMFLALAGSLGYLMTRHIYKKIIDPNNRKENLENLKKIECFISSPEEKELILKRIQNTPLYNAEFQIQIAYERYIKNNRHSLFIVNKLKNQNSDYIRFYEKHINEFSFADEIYPSIQKTYNKKFFNTALENFILDSVKNNDITKFNFLLISLHFSNNSYIDSIKQKSMQIAIENNNLNFIKNLIENPILSRFAKLKNNLFDYDWQMLYETLQTKSLDNSKEEQEVLRYLSPLIPKKETFKLFPKIKYK